MYTTKEAAQALRVDPETVRRYTRRTDRPLKAEQHGMRGALRIREDDLVEFCTQHGITVHLPQE